jgi:hypothetical protein
MPIMPKPTAMACLSGVDAIRLAALRGLVVGLGTKATKRPPNE